LQSVSRNGFSLAELIIGSGLTLFVIGLVMYFFSQANMTTEDISKRQHLLHVASSLLRQINKDLRSASETSVTANGISLKVNQLDEKSGIPESRQVDYEITAGEILRKEKDFTRTFSFASLLRADDRLSLSITQNKTGNSVFFLEIFAENSSGVELIKLKERLIKIDMTKSEPQ